ncbi:uncharacterized protein MYCFIDRAFT_170429 [Pseudocercospora fijiensis CIRAD86]|uniref:Myb-like domain-containing protein n=1 Tax=Pseudocercospora fijiensis (strain CIRAD86) TaxID=383855 RepID=N1Q7V9_PSEFD|nr:uncharacterized protein MYCFIDRAFT_170429 [Pseudocercospora fijiensis CIRAD86]EME88860.1 hypothetical protein MYCFIDRAFT_170429 [Pseudocercospora fijiensis CIRAD86]
MIRRCFAALCSVCDQDQITIRRCVIFGPYRTVPYRTVAHHIIPLATSPSPSWLPEPQDPEIASARDFPAGARGSGQVSYRTVPYRTVPYRTLPYRTLPYRTVPQLNLLSSRLLRPPTFQRRLMIKRRICEWNNMLLLTGQWGVAALRLRPWVQPLVKSRRQYLATESFSVGQAVDGREHSKSRHRRKWTAHETAELIRLKSCGVPVKDWLSHFSGRTYSSLETKWWKLVRKEQAEFASLRKRTRSRRTLTQEEQADVVALRHSGWTYKAIADKLGCQSLTAIRNVCLAKEHESTNPSISSRLPWSDEEIALLRTLLSDGLTRRALFAYFPGRSPMAINRQAFLLSSSPAEKPARSAGPIRRRVWSDEEDTQLKTLYSQGKKVSFIIKELGRTAGAVYLRVHQLRLVRPHDLRSQNGITPPVQTQNDCNKASNKVGTDVQHLPFSETGLNFLTHNDHLCFPTLPQLWMSIIQQTRYGTPGRGACFDICIHAWLNRKSKPRPSAETAHSVSPRFFMAVFCILSSHILVQEESVPVTGMISRPENVALVDSHHLPACDDKFSRSSVCCSGGSSSSLSGSPLSSNAKIFLVLRDRVLRSNLYSQPQKSFNNLLGCFLDVFQQFLLPRQILNPIFILSLSALSKRAKRLLNFAPTHPLRFGDSVATLPPRGRAMLVYSGLKTPTRILNFGRRRPKSEGTMTLNPSRRPMARHARHWGLTEETLGQLPILEKALGCTTVMCHRLRDGSLSRETLRNIDMIYESAWMRNINYIGLGGNQRQEFLDQMPHNPPSLAPPMTTRRAPSPDPEHPELQPHHHRSVLHKLYNQGGSRHNVEFPQRWKEERRHPPSTSIHRLLRQRIHILENLKFQPTSERFG